MSGEIIKYKDYSGVKNPLSKLRSRISYKAREKMYKKFIDLCQPTENDTVLDIGVTPDTFFRESNFFEKFYPWKDKVTMSSPEDAGNILEKYPEMKFVKTEPNQPLPFADGQFDIVFCSAVLEHVGGDGRQAEFLQEIFRVGKKVFLTTPNRWFPIEMHTFVPLIHYLPRKIHQAILRLFGSKFFSKTENLNLLTKGKIKKLIKSFDKDIYYKIYFNRTFGLKSNIILCLLQGRNENV